MQRIIVDGYNVIHADPQLKQAARSSLEGARDALIGRIKAYMIGRKLQITVVFDGAGGLTDMETVIPGKLQIIYGTTRQNADQLIIDTLQSSDNPRQFIVVTSDRADIGRAAGQMGAEVIDSPGFLDRIEPKRQSSSQTDDEDVDVDYWLDRFSKRQEENGEE